MRPLAQKAAERIKALTGKEYQAGSEESEKQAKTHWDVAMLMIGKGHTEMARTYLEKIIKECPGTSYAEKAKTKLKEL